MFTVIYRVGSETLWVLWQLCQIIKIIIHVLLTHWQRT